MLNRLALRLSTVRALRGRTLAGRNVRDSEMAPIDDIAAQHPTPVIVVYTDDGKFRTTGRDLWQCAGDKRSDVGYQHLVIEIVLTQRMRLVDDDGAEIDGAVPPVLDAALEFNLDIIERQVYAALMDPAPARPWADMWRRFVLDIGDRESQRGASMREGVRFAGRQIRLSVQLPRDPTPGADPGPLWTDFLALAGADADLQPLLPMINMALDAPDMPDWEHVAGTYGYTRAEARALQFAPPAPAEATSPDIAGITVETVPAPADLGTLP